MYVRRWASACALLGASLVVLVPAASQAAPHTSTGARCTIVGTAGRDVLTGTRGRDVICAFGGNDRINGRGGDDVIDAGPGRDAVDGGGGADRIYGGSGADTLDGGGGADLLSGGSGADRLLGDSGQDRIYGELGRDTTSGGAGDDVVTGGDGNDQETGDGGNDQVTGGLGDDDLNGGSGADDVDGGAGFNVCDAPTAPGDTQVRCVVDSSPPVVGEASSSPSTVDVSDAGQVIRIEAHVTDDTGVKSVQIGNLATLVSGTPRDGVWAASMVVPRYLTPGPRDVDVDVRDRVGRWTSTTIHGVYTVVDTLVDQEMPVLQSLSLSTASVDVRSASQPITATIHVTDDLAGPSDVYLCPAHSFPTGTPSFRQAGGCVFMQRASGTPTDSTYDATYDVPQGAPDGTWNFEVWISDAAGNRGDDYWFGPDAWAALGATNEPHYRAIPGGEGVFTVQGTEQDLNAPVLSSLHLNPSAVDTANGAVRVTADIAGTDVEGITGADLFINGYAGYPNNPNWVDNLTIAWVQDFQLVSGTPQNGVWRTTFVVPGGTPDGEYFIQAALQDSSHFESWVSPDSGWTTNNHLLTDDLAPGGLHFVVANS